MKELPIRTATVLGAGSWGTALAVHLAQVGHDVRLWGRDEAFVADLSRRRANAVYLPDITFPASLTPTASLPDALAGVDLVVVAVPSHGLRQVLRQGRAHVSRTAVVVSATKGLEEGTLLRMSEVIASEWPLGRAIAALSGPSFAVELARQLPTAVVVASADVAAVEHVQEEFRSTALRLYGSRDLVGVEIGGALKNVIAIAAGVAEGLGLGHNAIAALITRGLAEISRLAVGLGAERDTLAGLAGLGDLVLTCTGQLSRNRHVGAELARGRSLADILASTKMVAEGVRTTSAALALAERTGLELPIATQMAAVLDGRKDPTAALLDLMGRRQRAEAETR
ncbi:MAG: NAD(P)H-dependent glycerol-3-phosphate dehydrogenase [Vicinamibacterales bacterium]|nr:NAD(P)H-dependent glycerol-3-phosphate dehydrogenase [Vicinamibacterales bacterium]